MRGTGVSSLRRHRGRHAPGAAKLAVAHLPPSLPGGSLPGGGSRLPSADDRRLEGGSVTWGLVRGTRQRLVR